jgi:hypothetical protein
MRTDMLLELSTPSLPTPISHQAKKIRLSPEPKTAPDNDAKKLLRSPLFLGSESTSSVFYPSSPPPYHKLSPEKQHFNEPFNADFGFLGGFNDDSAMGLEVTGPQIESPLLPPAETVQPASYEDDDFAAMLDFLGDCVQIKE